MKTGEGKGGRVMVPVLPPPSLAPGLPWVPARARVINLPPPGELH